jgi:NADPH:quinone reductase-like Zn-dependent oxidoreductase
MKEAAMKAALVARYGSVQVGEVEKPKPAEGQVLVHVRASSLNALDWYAFSGRPAFARPLMGFRKPRSSAIGADFAGVVESVGEGVDDFAPGDEVYGCVTGSLAEYVVTGKAVARKPANVSFEEAATVPVAGFTALQGLRDHGDVKPGQRVLVNGAGGGVGTYALQIAKTLGAEVHAVCSTGNVEQSRELGADRVFDYTREDFTRSGGRYDVIFDNAGSRSWRSMCRVLAPKGIVVLVGGSRRKRLFGPIGHVVRVKLASVLGRRKAVFFISKPNREDLAALRDLIESGRVKPVIELRYELAQISEALHEMDDGHARAKIVVTVPSSVDNARAGSAAEVAVSRGGPSSR